MVGAQVVHLLDPLAEQAWSASGLWASLPGPLKLCSVLFCWHRIGPKGPPEARSQYTGTDLGVQQFLLRPNKWPRQWAGLGYLQGGQLTPKVGHSNLHSVHSFPGDILIP
jgi:hypothetical protein